MTDGNLQNSPYILLMKKSWKNRGISSRWGLPHDWLIIRREIFTKTVQDGIGNGLSGTEGSRNWYF